MSRALKGVFWRLKGSLDDDFLHCGAPKPVDTFHRALDWYSPKSVDKYDVKTDLGNANQCLIATKKIFTILKAHVKRLVLFQLDLIYLFQ